MIQWMHYNGRVYTDDSVLGLQDDMRSASAPPNMDEQTAAASVTTNSDIERESLQ